MNRAKKNQTIVKVHPSSIAMLTDATWDFAHAVLWHKQPFSEKEINLSKKYIKEYYDLIPAEKFSSSALHLFTGYCERVVLARDYVRRKPHRYIPHPTIWLDRKNPKGFAGTKAWYDVIKKERRERATQQMIESYRYYPMSA